MNFVVGGGGGGLLKSGNFTYSCMEATVAVERFQLILRCSFQHRE